MSALHPTQYRFAHHRVIDGRRHLIWGNGIGDIEPIPAGTKLYRDALNDRPWQPNNLADEGEENILEVYFRGASAPASFYGRLFNDTPVDDDALGDLTGEPTGNGYAAVEWEAGEEDFGSPAASSGDMQITSTTKQFTATGAGWGPVTYLVLATAATGTSGLLIAYSALTASRTLIANDTLDVSISIKLS